MTMVTNASPGAGAKRNRQQRRQAARSARTSQGPRGATGARNESVRNNNDLNVALRRYRESKLDKAAAICSRILARTPEHPDALDLLDPIARHMGQGETAVQLLGRLLETRRDGADILKDLAVALKRRGKRDQAVVCYR